MFLLVFNIMIQLAGQHGFGQTMAEIGNDHDMIMATLYECSGQAVAIIGMSIAKCSLGTFLLRLVVVSWHEWLIWFFMAFVVLASISTFFPNQSPRLGGIPGI